MTKTKFAFLSLIIIVILSRIFFLNAGYGSEEDAWGVGLTAKHITATGEYEASRLPGHPLQCRDGFLFLACMHVFLPHFAETELQTMFSCRAVPGIYSDIVYKQQQQHGLPVGTGIYDDFLLLAAP